MNRTTLKDVSTGKYFLLGPTDKYDPNRIFWTKVDADQQEGPLCKVRPVRIVRGMVIRRDTVYGYKEFKEDFEVLDVTDEIKKTILIEQGRLRT